MTKDQFVHFGFLDSGSPPGQNTTYATPGKTTDKLNGPPVFPSEVLPDACTETNGDPIGAPTPSFNLGTNDPTPVTEPIKQYGNINIHL